MRLFIAVKLTEQLRQEVATLQKELRSTGGDVKWVEPENLHLTLKFLGEVSEDRLPPLKAALQQATLHLSPFTVSLEGVGAFPRLEHPRVLWVGVNTGKEPLIQLAQKVEQACSPFILPAPARTIGGSGSLSKEDRPFSAHLTIGRARSSERLAQLVKKLQGIEFKGQTVAPVGQITLFQSTLSPKGPIYTCLAEIPLG